MSTAQINVSAPVYFGPGEVLNGETLAAPQWVRSGPATVSLEKAKALQADGYADIVAVGGRPYVWGACCSGADHAHE